jgi:hypothetical protein
MWGLVSRMTMDRVQATQESHQPMGTAATSLWAQLMEEVLPGPGGADKSGNLSSEVERH